LAETLRLSQYWSKLEVIHVAYGLAQQEVETAIGVPICQPDCGRCCAENSISCYGFEAEYVGSCLIGAGLLKEGLDRARAWLTEPGQWTYGSKLNLEKLKELVPELRRASLSPCCFLMDDKKCMIWNSRPMVCRAYGVTRMPGPICPRRLGIGEDFLHRVTWDPDHPKVPVRPLFNSLIGMVREPNYLRQAFLPMMLFQRFRADELAGLAYDGKIPLVKLHVGWGEGISMLWQEQVERDWTAQLADQSIAEQVPLVERDGKLIMTVKDGGQ
jgi:Fe-S-cluster containining protein